MWPGIIDTIDSGRNPTEVGVCLRGNLNDPACSVFPDWQTAWRGIARGDPDLLV